MTDPIGAQPIIQAPQIDTTSEVAGGAAVTPSYIASEVPETAPVEPSIGIDNIAISTGVTTTQTTATTAAAPQETTGYIENYVPEEPSIADQVMSDADNYSMNSVQDIMSSTIYITPDDNNVQALLVTMKSLGVINDGMTMDQTAQAIHNYVSETFNYQPDNCGDYWQTAAETFRSGGGDCEDLANLEASLLTAALISRGISPEEASARVSCVVVGDVNAYTQHVYVSYKGDDGRVIYFDPSTSETLTAFGSGKEMVFSYNTKTVTFLDKTFDYSKVDTAGYSTWLNQGYVIPDLNAAIGKVVDPLITEARVESETDLKILNDAITQFKNMVATLGDVQAQGLGGVYAVGDEDWATLDTLVAEVNAQIKNYQDLSSTLPAADQITKDDLNAVDAAYGLVFMALSAASNQINTMLVELGTNDVINYLKSPDITVPAGMLQVMVFNASVGMTYFMNVSTDADGNQSFSLNFVVPGTYDSLNGFMGRIDPSYSRLGDALTQISSSNLDAALGTVDDNNQISQAYGNNMNAVTTADTLNDLFAYRAIENYPEEGYTSGTTYHPGYPDIQQSWLTYVGTIAMNVTQAINALDSIGTTTPEIDATKAEYNDLLTQLEDMSTTLSTITQDDLTGWDDLGAQIIVIHDKLTGIQTEVATEVKGIKVFNNGKLYNIACYIDTSTGVEKYYLDTTSTSTDTSDAIISSDISSGITTMNKANSTLQDAIDTMAGIDYRLVTNDIRTAQTNMTSDTTDLQTIFSKLGAFTGTFTQASGQTIVNNLITILKKTEPVGEELTLASSTLKGQDINGIIFFQTGANEAQKSNIISHFTQMTTAINALDTAYANLKSSMTALNTMHLEDLQNTLNDNDLLFGAYSSVNPDINSLRTSIAALNTAMGTGSPALFDISYGGQTFTFKKTTDPDGNIMFVIDKVTGGPGTGAVNYTDIVSALAKANSAYGTVNVLLQANPDLPISGTLSELDGYRQTLQAMVNALDGALSSSPGKSDVIPYNDLVTALAGVSSVYTGTANVSKELLSAASELKILYNGSVYYLKMDVNASGSKVYVFDKVTAPPADLSDVLNYSDISNVFAPLAAANTTFAGAINQINAVDPSLVNADQMASQAVIQDATAKFNGLMAMIATLGTSSKNISGIISALTAAFGASAALVNSADTVGREAQKAHLQLTYLGLSGAVAGSTTVKLPLCSDRNNLMDQAYTDYIRATNFQENLMSTSIQYTSEELIAYQVGGMTMVQRLDNFMLDTMRAGEARVDEINHAITIAMEAVDLVNSSLTVTYRQSVLDGANINLQIANAQYTAIANQYEGFPKWCVENLAQCLVPSSFYQLRSAYNAAAQAVSTASAAVTTARNDLNNASTAYANYRATFTGNHPEYASDASLRQLIQTMQDGIMTQRADGYYEFSPDKISVTDLNTLNSTRFDLRFSYYIYQQDLVDILNKYSMGDAKITRNGNNIIVDTTSRISSTTENQIMNDIRAKWGTAVARQENPKNVLGMAREIDEIKGRLTILALVYETKRDIRNLVEQELTGEAQGGYKGMDISKLILKKVTNMSSRLQQFISTAFTAVRIVNATVNQNEINQANADYLDRFNEIQDNSSGWQFWNDEWWDAEVDTLEAQSTNLEAQQAANTRLADADAANQTACQSMLNQMAAATGNSNIINAVGGVSNLEQQTTDTTDDGQYHEVNRTNADSLRESIVGYGNVMRMMLMGAEALASMRNLAHQEMTGISGRSMRTDITGELNESQLDAVTTWFDNTVQAMDDKIQARNAARKAGLDNANIEHQIDHARSTQGMGYIAKALSAIVTVVLAVVGAVLGALAGFGVGGVAGWAAGAAIGAAISGMIGGLLNGIRDTIVGLMNLMTQEDTVIKYTTFQSSHDASTINTGNAAIDITIDVENSAQQSVDGMSPDDYLVDNGDGHTGNNDNAGEGAWNGAVNGAWGGPIGSLIGAITGAVGGSLSGYTDSFHGSSSIDYLALDAAERQITDMMAVMSVMDSIRRNQAEMRNLVHQEMTGIGGRSPSNMATYAMEASKGQMNFAMDQARSNIENVNDRRNQEYERDRTLLQMAQQIINGVQSGLLSLIPVIGGLIANILDNNTRRDNLQEEANANFESGDTSAIEYEMGGVTDSLNDLADPDNLIDVGGNHVGLNQTSFTDARNRMTRLFIAQNVLNNIQKAMQQMRSLAHMQMTGVGSRVGGEAMEQVTTLQFQSMMRSLENISSYLTEVADVRNRAADAQLQITMINVQQLVSEVTLGLQVLLIIASALFPPAATILMAVSSIVGAVSNLINSYIKRNTDSKLAENDMGELMHQLDAMRALAKSNPNSAENRMDHVTQEAVDEIATQLMEALGGGSIGINRGMGAGYKALLERAFRALKTINAVKQEMSKLRNVVNEIMTGIGGVEMDSTAQALSMQLQAAKAMIDDAMKLMDQIAKRRNEISEAQLQAARDGVDVVTQWVQTVITVASACLAIQADSGRSGRTPAQQTAADEHNQSLSTALSTISSVTSIMLTMYKRDALGEAEKKADQQAKEIVKENKEQSMTAALLAGPMDLETLIAANQMEQGKQSLTDQKMKLVRRTQKQGKEISDELTKKITKLVVDMSNKINEAGQKAAKKKGTGDQAKKLEKLEKIKAKIDKIAAFLNGDPNQIVQMCKGLGESMKTFKNAEEQRSAATSATVEYADKLIKDMEAKTAKLSEALKPQEIAREKKLTEVFNDPTKSLTQDELRDLYKLKKKEFEGLQRSQKALTNGIKDSGEEVESTLLALSDAESSAVTHHTETAAAMADIEMSITTLEKRANDKTNPLTEGQKKVADAEIGKLKKNSAEMAEVTMKKSKEDIAAIQSRKGSLESAVRNMNEELARVETRMPVLQREMADIKALLDRPGTPETGTISSFTPMFETPVFGTVPAADTKATVPSTGTTQ